MEELAEQTVVVTQFTPGTDFGAFRTFALDDVIEIVLELDGGDAVRTVDPAIANPTLDTIAAELTARGYQRVDRSAQPDLGVAVTAVVRLKATANFGVWWGYGAATGAYWGYQGSSVATGMVSTGVALWKSGALVIELYDLRKARAASAPSSPPTPTIAAPSAPDDAGVPPPLEVVWIAFVYGVIGGAEATVQAPPLAAVQQAFAQSPYLRVP